MRILVVVQKNTTKIFPVRLAYVVSALRKNGHDWTSSKTNLH